MVRVRSVLVFAVFVSVDAGRLRSFRLTLTKPYFSLRMQSAPDAERCPLKTVPTSSRRRQLA